MENALHRFTQAIADILQGYETSIYLYGSAVLSDYRPDWSDIDLLVLTAEPLLPQQTEQLLMLRQVLLKQYPNSTIYRSFEGCVLPIDHITKGYPTNIVYWGTSGQRLLAQYTPDPFCLWQLHHCARLLYGPDVRHSLPIPTPNELIKAVDDHLQTILVHGRGSRSLYAFGWLLDVARGLYTLQTGEVASKTAAGEWALSQGLCPDATSLMLALAVRKEPSLLLQPDVIAHAEALTPAIQRFAMVLQQALLSRRPL